MTDLDRQCEVQAKRLQYLQDSKTDFEACLAQYAKLLKSRHIQLLKQVEQQYLATEFNRIADQADRISLDTTLNFEEQRFQQELEAAKIRLFTFIQA